MSSFTVGAVRSVRIPPCAILVAAFSLLSPSVLSATTAAPQPLPYTVTIVAGGGTHGTTGTSASPFTVGQACATGSALTATDTVGDGCLATQVLLSAPTSTAVDSEGNLFVLDSNNHSIRRIDAHTGIITTIAGSTATATNPTHGAACATGSSLTSTDAYGDGCPAIDVYILDSEAIAVDAAGNVWFTDYALGAVREVVKSTGIIQTIVNTAFTPGYKAGNVSTTIDPGNATVLAANGWLFRPYGLTFDKQGNLYIADEGNNTVEVVNLGSTATTIAGNTIAAGAIFTIAGSGCAYVSAAEPGATASSCYSFTGYSNGTSPYPSTGATLEDPYQVAVDSSGNIYITDEYNYNVRWINTAGDISYFAGVGTGGGVKMSKTTGLVRGPANTTDLAAIYGVATDPLGNVYVDVYSSSSPYANYIDRVDIATDGIYPIAGQTLESNTTAPAADTAQVGATYCTAKTDAIGDGCPGLLATFWKPYFPVVDAAGNVYVTDYGDNLVRKISTGTQFPATAIGTPVTQNVEVHFGAGDSPASSSPYTLPAGFTEFTAALSSTGCTTNSDTTTDCVLNVTFTPAAAGVRTAPLTVTSASGLVSRLSLTGTGLAPVLALDPGTKSTLASTGLTAVTAIALDDAGNAYAAVPGASAIVKVTSAGVESNVGTSLSRANAVAVDASGNVYAALANGSIVEMPGNGGSQITLNSGFTNPAGIAVDSFGNAYVADAAANSVSEVLATNAAQIVLANQTTVPSLSGPTGVAVDSYGNVFVANTIGNSVIELPFNGSAAVTLGSGLSSPTGLAVDPAGSLYIADGRNSRIVFIPNENGTLNTADQIAIITGLGSPSGVAVAGNGTVYVADSYANAIYTFARSGATINLGNALTAIGVQPAATNSAAADIISMGTQPVTFGSSFAAESGTNTADFALLPTSIPVTSSFPAAGYGVSLTAKFTPGALGSRSAAFTFDSTNVTQPTLALSGTGIQPHDTTTTTVTTTPPTGQTNWIYGQTVVVNITVSVNSGLPAPTGSVSVYVDGSSTAAGSPSLTAGTASSTVAFSIPALSAGPHTISVSYGGDTESSASTGSLNLTLAKATLTVTANNLSKPFDAPVPTLTGVLTGVVNGDQIGVNYSTSATASSPAGSYPISASVTGTAVSNYTVNIVAGTLTVAQDSTVTMLGTSATSVNSTTQVTLTATVSNQTSYAIVTVPTGSVTFYNGSTVIGSAQLNSSGVATYVTSFAVVGQTTNNPVTAVYSGDPDFLTSTSTVLTIVSGTPTFTLAPMANASLTVAPGQSGLMTFTLVPAFGYNGTISFSCNAPASVSCIFAPAQIISNGSSTPNLIAITFNTQQAANSLTTSRRLAGIAGSGTLPFSLAAIPGLALLFGFSRRRRRLLRGSRFLLLAVLCLLGLGLSGCGGSAVSIAPTPAGNDSITVVASGTGGSFASVKQQFTVTLIVQ